MSWRVEGKAVSKMGSVAWLRWAGPFDTRAEAEREMTCARQRGTGLLRIVELKP